MAFLFPINWFTVPAAKDSSAQQFSANVVDRSVFVPKLDRKSSARLKGKWWGGTLVAVSPAENFWIAGNLVFITLQKDPEKTQWRIRTLGNIFASLLFIVVVIQWTHLGLRLLEGMPLGDIFTLRSQTSNPLFQVLLSSGFYAMLYLNFVRKSLLYWRHALPQILNNHD